jgi:ATP-dependent helicase HrpA
VSPHLRITFAVHDDSGAVLASGKELDALRRRLAGRMRLAVAAASPIEERRGMTTWDVGTVPSEVETLRNGMVVRGYPALLDDGTSVSLRVFTNVELQQRVHRGGVRRLLLLASAPSHAAMVRPLSNADRLAVARCGRFTLGELVDDCIVAAADGLMADRDLPWDADAFAELRTVVRDGMATTVSRALRDAVAVCAAAVDVASRLDRLVVPAVQPAVADSRAQLDRLVRPGFVTATALARLPDVLRYVRGIERRLDKLPSDPVRDAQRMAEVTALERRYSTFVRSLPARAVTAEVIEAGWQLEELRVGLFAQALGTSRPVSTKRVEARLRVLGA